MNLNIVSTSARKFTIVFTICLSALTLRAQAQNSKPIIISSYDSIEVSNVKAIGSKQTGSVTISIDFKNNYSKPGVFTIGCGVFGDFGITDTLGKKYKVFSYNMYQKVNAGYTEISSVQFGDKKPNDFNLMQVSIDAGETRTLTLKLKKVNQQVSYISEVHVLPELALDLIHLNARNILTVVRSIKIDWD